MVDQLKTKTVTVPDWDGGRDGGKVFLLTEMPSAQAEAWALRMFVALKGHGNGIPESAQRLGMVGVAFAGINAFMQADVDPDVLIPLLNEMLSKCVKRIRDPKVPVPSGIDISPTDIMDVATRVWLRSEVLNLHTNFSLTDAFWRWMSDWKTLKDSLETTSTSPP